MPKAAQVLRNALVSAPGAIAAGVGREMTDKAIRKTEAHKTVPKELWWVTAGMLALGLGGMAAEHITRNPVWGQASAGLYHGGLVYAGQDGARVIRQKLQKNGNGSGAYTSAQAARTQAARAQAAAAHRTAVGGEYVV